MQTWLLLTTYIKEVQPTTGAVYMTANGNTGSRNSQIVRRNNSSIWEKPSLLPKRTASSAPAHHLHDISEHSDYKDNTVTYRSHSTTQPDVEADPISPPRSRRSSRGISRSTRGNSRPSSRNTSRNSRPSSIHKSIQDDNPSQSFYQNPSEQDYGFNQNSFHGEDSYHSKNESSRIPSYREQPPINPPQIHQDYPHPDPIEDDPTYDNPYDTYDQPYEGQEQIEEDFPPPPPRHQPKPTWR